MRQRGHLGQAKRVVFVHDSNEYGGMEVHMLMLLRYFDQHRYMPAVMVPGYTEPHYASPPRFVDEVQALGAPLLRPPHPGSPLKFGVVREIYNIKALLHTAKADIVHIHTNLPTAARKVALAARLAGVPIVRSEHLPPSAFPLPPLARYTVKPFDYLTRCIVATSRYCKNEQIQLMRRAPEKLHLSYYGIEMERFQPVGETAAYKRRIGLDPALPLIGAVGRLVEQKGHIDLIDAVARIIQSFGPVNVVIVGGGPLEQRLRDQAERLGIARYVHLVGYQPDALPYLQAIDIMTMPSLFEALGIALLEALAMRKPVVVTDLACFQELVEHQRSGLIVPRHSPCQLADAIRMLLEHSDLAASLAQQGMEQIRVKFTIQQNVNNIMALYDRVLSGGDVSAQVVESHAL